MEKSKVMILGREGVAPQVKVERNGVFVSSFKYLGYSFSND